MLIDSKYVKIRVATPKDGAEAVRNALGRNGAGTQGKYSHCTGSYRQIGRFLPMEGSRPAIGRQGMLEEVEEEVIEAICHIDLVEIVIEEVKKVHPYEEPAIDIIPRLEIK